MVAILALDTATEACTVAIHRDGEDFQRFEIAPRRHAEIILSMIESLLQESKLTLQDMDAIAYGCGPGSFMGIRIAAGVTQGIAYASKKPVISVSSLQILAQTAYEKTKCENIIAGWDARMGEIYWGAYQAQNDLMRSIQSDALNKPADIHLWDDREWMFVGNAWQVYREHFSKSLLDQQVEILAGLYPDANALAKIALEELRQGKLITAEEALPVYLRDQVAEIKT